MYLLLGCIHLVRPHKSGYFTTMVRCLFPRRYTAGEAAAIIVEDLPLDNNAETDIEDIETDDEPVFDVLDREQEEEPSSSRYDNDQEKESSLSEAESETSENQAERGEPGWIKTLKKRIREQDSDKEFSSEPMVGNATNQDQARKQGRRIREHESNAQSSSSQHEEETTDNEPLVGDQHQLAESLSSEYEDETENDMNDASDDYDANQNRVWSKTEKDEISVEDRPFNSPQGPLTNCFDDCNNEVDYFLKFLSEDIREIMLYQTYLYVSQKQRRVLALSEKELFSFLGVNLIMGYHKLPSLSDHWRNDQDLCVPFVFNALPRNRFTQILANLHMNDNESVPQNNKDWLYKLRPFIDMLNRNYKLLYNISEYLSIDESMVLFKGRSTMKQYNPLKPIKHGYKIWMRAAMDGYISKFSIYQGKNSDTVTMHNPPSCFGLGEQVVFSLTEDLWQKSSGLF